MSLRPLYVTISAKIYHISAQIFQIYFIKTHIIVMLMKYNFATNAEFNVESFKAYRMQIPLLELKILMNI